MTSVGQLQSEISAEERAIRHLIGERKALTSKIARLEAKEKLQVARLRKLEKTVPRLAVASRFPDVSNNNASVDINTVRHGAGAVRVGELLVTKITEGLTFKDQPGLERAQLMASVRFPRRGFYAYLHPAQGGMAQAEFLLATLHDAGIVLGPGDIIIADLETSDGQPATAVASCAADFGHHIGEHFTGPRWLYGGGPFLHEFGVTLQGFTWHWLAAYVSNPAPYEVFGPVRTKAWQFTDGHYGPQPHTCPGIGPCDLSIVLR